MSEYQELRLLVHCRYLLGKALQTAGLVAHEDSVLAIQAAIARIEADIKAVRGVDA